VDSLKLNPNYISYGLGNATDLDFNVLANYIHTFNSNLLLELKASYTRSNNQSYPDTTGQNPNQAFGQPNVNTPISESTAWRPSMSRRRDFGRRYSSSRSRIRTIPLQYLGALSIPVEPQYQGGRHVIRRQLVSFQSSFPEALWVLWTTPVCCKGSM